MGDEEVVQPARTRQADLVGGIEDGGGIGKQRARVVEGQRLQEALRRQAGPAGEQALEGERLEADMIGDALERRLVPPLPRNELDSAAHGFVIRHLAGGGFGIEAHRGRGRSGGSHDGAFHREHLLGSIAGI